MNKLTRSNSIKRFVVLNSKFFIMALREKEKLQQSKE